MSKVRFYKEEQIPLEMHKVRVVQKLTLLPVEERSANSVKLTEPSVLLSWSSCVLQCLAACSRFHR